MVLVNGLLLWPHGLHHYMPGTSPKLIPVWQGPYVIVRQAPFNEKVYYIREKEGKELTYPVSVLRLKSWTDEKDLDK